MVSRISNSIGSEPSELIPTHVAIWGRFETRPYNYFGVRRKKVCPVTYLVASESR